MSHHKPGACRSNRAQNRSRAHHFHFLRLRWHPNRKTNLWNKFEESDYNPQDSNEFESPGEDTGKTPSTVTAQPNPIHNTPTGYKYDSRSNSTSDSIGEYTLDINLQDMIYRIPIRSLKVFAYTRTARNYYNLKQKQNLGNRLRN